MERANSHGARCRKPSRQGWSRTQGWELAGTTGPFPTLTSLEALASAAAHELPHLLVDTETETIVHGDVWADLFA